MKYYYCCCGKQLINLETEGNQRKGYGEFVCDKCGEIYRTKIKEIYETSSDITFIMEYAYNGETEDLISSEVKGFYHGSPDRESTRKYYGKLKAEYEI